LIGIITGSGLYGLSGLERAESTIVDTPYGKTGISSGLLAGNEIAFVARHGDNHEYLPNTVNYRSNIYALKEAGARAIVATSVMGVLDRSLDLARAILFDDLYFPENRLPGGELCTFFTEPGQPGRGHYMFGSPFSSTMRQVAMEVARSIGAPIVEGGVYGHVHGPRFNSRVEIGRLQSLGVTAISQTCGPETVLAGELEIPYLLIGFGVDYANGVSDEPTPIDVLDGNLNLSAQIMPRLLQGITARLSDRPIPFEGFVYRFE